MVLVWILYTYMQRSGLDSHQMLGDDLVRLLAHVGNMHAALQVYHSRADPKAASLHSIISSCVEYGMPQLALILYESSQKNHTSFLGGRTFVTLLKACVQAKDVDSGRMLHDHAFHSEMLKRNPFVGSALVDMYCKFGLLAKAKQVFDGLPMQDVVTWTTLIAGYAENGHSEEALACLAEMERDGVCPNGTTYVCVLKACTNLGDIEKAQDIHIEVERRGLLEEDTIVGNTLVDIYARCGLLAMAAQVLEKLPVHNLVSWTALITGYSEHGNGEKALYCFEQMQLEGIHPDSLTYASILKACGALGASNRGRELHAELKRKGLLVGDIFIGTALVDMYAKCSLLAEAQQLFDDISVRDAISWNSLISGFAENGCGMEAIRCFEQMQLECILPNSVSFACTLKACGDIGATLKGEEIHARVERKGVLAKDAIVATALVDMYAKVGLLVNAQEVFDKLPIRDVATWNALITGYTEQDLGEEAFKYFEQMQLEGVAPNKITFVCIVKACGILGAADKGEELHTEIERRGFFDKDTIGNALVYMYAKCGWLVKAQRVFDKLVIQDAVAWTALMAGYAQLGEIEHVIHIFDRMLGGGVKPSLVTFIIILNACSLRGLSKESETYFEIMSKDYGIAPAPHHYTCLVDLHSRVGQLDEAVAKIKEMPWESNLITWHAVIEACKYSGNYDFANKAFELALGGRETCHGAAHAMQPHVETRPDLLDEVNMDEALIVNEV